VDPRANPYRPGAGQRPLELAGRDRELTSAAVVLDRIGDGEPDRGIVLVGLRGFGKTVLLQEFRAMAATRDWITAWVEAGADGATVQESLAASLNLSLRSLASKRSRSVARRALAVFKSFSLSIAPDGRFTVGIDVDAARGRASTGVFDIDLTELLLELSEAAAAGDAGVAIFVDEVQDVARSDLAAIVSVTHAMNQAQARVATFGAGLPSVPAVLADARSYAERLFAYREVDALDDAASAIALRRPAEARDVVWTDGAITDAVSAARGYPYFLQEYGRSIWEVAGKSPITARDAAWGIEIAQRDLETGFYRGRWERATDAQQDYLAAVATLLGVQDDDDGRVTTNAISVHMGRPQRSLSPLRDQLINKHLLYAPDRGSIAFTVPGMAAYVRRQRSAS
jgi:hypothetical protein